MMVSFQHRLTYLAMPKTGSSAVEAVLRTRTDIQISGEPRLKHMPLQRYNRFIVPLLEAYGGKDFETVCLFREPFDWLLSWYRFRRRPGMKEVKNSTRDVDFPAFVEAYLSADPPPFARLGRPSQFVQGKDGRPGVTRIFRYENFEAFAAFLSQRFGETLLFPERNVSPKEEVEYLPALRARVEAAMAEEYRIWREVAV